MLKGVEWAVYRLLCFRRALYQGATFIVHNAKGFDSYLIFNSMRELVLESSVIMHGSKILFFTDPITGKIL